MLIDQCSARWAYRPLAEQRYFLKFSVRTQSTTSFNLKGSCHEMNSSHEKNCWSDSHLHTHKHWQACREIPTWSLGRRFSDWEIHRSVCFDPAPVLIQRCLRRRIPQMRRLALVKPAAAASRLFQYKSHDKHWERVTIVEKVLLDLRAHLTRTCSNISGIKITDRVARHAGLQNPNTEILPELYNCIVGCTFLPF